LPASSDGTGTGFAAILAIGLSSSPSFPARDRRVDASIRIIAADPQPEMQRYYAEMLPRMGYDLVGVVKTGRALVQRCRTDGPDLVICDIDLRDMDAVAAAEQIAQEAAVPMIVLTSREPASLPSQVAARRGLTFLVKPVTRAMLGAEIPLAVRRYHDVPKTADYGEGAGENDRN
jgi:AmiR/NasT family two-component response regulator